MSKSILPDPDSTELLTDSSDYVSAVLGMFGIFVAVTWWFTKKDYHGPVSDRYGVLEKT
jgi:hypothetical protein